MTCSKCGATCQGNRCQQCEIEDSYQHLADDLASDDRGDDDE